MRARLLAAVATLMCCATELKAQNSLASVPSLWSLNDSVVSLMVAGNVRRFYYRVPRSGLREAGVAPGTLLFDGVQTGNIYTGTAYVFSKTCGAIAYQTSGSVSADQRQVVLRGRAPLVNPSTCEQAAFRDDDNVFDFLSMTSPPPVVARTDEIDQAREDARREAQAYFQQQLDAKTQQLNAALNQEQWARRDAEAQVRSALQRLTAAEAKVQELEAAASVSPGVTESIPSDETARSDTVDKLGAAGPASLVLLISFLIEVFKRLTKRGVSLGREFLIETLASFASGVFLTWLGYSSELKILSVPVPLAGGLLTVALMLSVKHLAGHDHGMDISAA